MPEHSHVHTPASWAVLRWLTNAGPHIPSDIRDRLLGELFTSPRAVLMGVLNGLVLNVAALFLSREPTFAVFMVVDVALAVIRLVVLRRTRRATDRGMPTPTDAYLISAILWCGLQGAMAFTAMRSGNHALQLLSATTIMGLLGPLCARNYPAPRFALLLVSLCDLPFVAGAASSGERWLLVLVLQTPLYLLGSMNIISRFQTMSLTTLRAQRESQHRALHDPLTGLLNRAGFAEVVGEYCGTGLTSGHALLCLDLDGFKAVNDTLGHQAGDELLQAVARRLTSTVRSGDPVARFGGDEFIILVRDMVAAEIDDLVSRVIERVAAEPYLLHGSQLVRIGVSIGYACAPDDGTALESLYRCADAALYEAKAAGKGTGRRFACLEETRAG